MFEWRNESLERFRKDDGWIDSTDIVLYYAPVFICNLY